MTRPKVSFRTMTIADIPAVIRVEHASFPTPWTRQAFYNELAYNQFAHYIVVVKNEQVIGYVGMWLIMNEAHITNIAIHPDDRGKGYGEQTLNHAMEVARRHGADRMTLEVRVSNHIAQALYQKKGFEPTGRRPRYYTDNHEDALIMWACLKEGVDDRTTMLDTGNRNEL